MLQLLSQAVLRLGAGLSSGQRSSVPLDELHRRQHAGAAGDPCCDAEQTLSPCRCFGEYEDMGLPVGRRLWLVGQLPQALLDPSVAIGAPAVLPRGRRSGPLQIAVKPPEDAQCQDARHRVDHQHDEAAEDGAGKAGAGVEETKSRPEGRARPNRLDIGGVVQQAIGHQERHRDQCSNRVEITDRDGDQRDPGRQYHPASRVSRRAIAHGEERERLEQVISGQRLEDSGSTKERCEGGRQSG